MTARARDVAPAADGWKERGACRGLGPDIWYPAMGEGHANAVAVCNSCPVRRACLEDALARHEEWGIWGGLSETERRAVLLARNGAHPEMARAPRRKATGPPNRTDPSRPAAAPAMEEGQAMEQPAKRLARRVR